MEWWLRHPGGMATVRHPEKMGCRPGGMAAEVSGENGMSVGYDCAEISGWNGGCETSRGNGMSAGYDYAEISGSNGDYETSRENGLSAGWNDG